METNNIIKKNELTKIIKKHHQNIKKICLYSKSKYNDELIYIAVGIYIIETKYRPTIIRILEYLKLIYMFVLNQVFMKKIDNITIGHYQLGLSYILLYYDNKINLHIKTISKINKKQFKEILKSIKFENNLKIALIRINYYYNILKENKQKIRKIGELYNGKYAYGIILENICSLLKKEGYLNKYIEETNCSTKNTEFL